MTSSMETFGNTIRVARIKLRITQGQLLDQNPDFLYGVEDRRRALSNLEQDRLFPDDVPNAIFEAAEALDLDKAELTRLAYDHERTDRARELVDRELRRFGMSRK